MQEESGFLTPAEVATRLGVRQSRMYELIKRRAVPSVVVCGRIRIPRDAWEQWMQQMSTAAMASLVDEPGGVR